MMYGIHRIEKRCRADVYGIQLEANRTVKDHLNGREFPGSDIDWLKTKENVFLVKNDNWNKTITNMLKERNIKPRKNSVVLLDAIYTASAEFFENKTKAQIIEYFKACLDFHEKAYGTYVINAVIHFDEVKNGNIHFHVASCPILDKENGTASLSARDLMGGREQYRKRQDEFYNEVSSLWGLDRGEVKDYAEVRKHISKMEYEAQEATIKAQKAKAELNIRERVNEACAYENEPIEIIKTREYKVQRKPTTVEIKASDFERLKEQVKTSRDLKNSLNCMEKLAKETIEAAAIDERVIEAEREVARLRNVNRSLEKTINTRDSRISELNDYISRMEALMQIIQKWMQNQRIYKRFVEYMDSRNTTIREVERERVIEYERY